DDGDHAAAGGRLDAELRHLLLQALLHLLRLLHHGLDVHNVITFRRVRVRLACEAPRNPSYISSTSRISAGNTSSIAWTVDDDMASAFRSRCCSVALPGSGIRDPGSGG